MSTLNIAVTVGKQFADNELITAAKLNQILGSAVFALLGTITSTTIADGSITTPKLVDGILSADAAGRAKMADGFLITSKLADGVLSADAPGRAKMADGFVTAVKLEEGTRGSTPQYFVCASASGTAYVVTLTPAATVYTAGMVIRFKADVANTGACTVNVNGLGAKSLVKGVATALAAGDIPLGQVVEAVYDGTNFAVKGPVAYAAAEAVVASARGLVVQNNAGAPNSKADISATEFVLKDGTTGRTFLASAVAVTVDMGLGVAVNGLDAGVEASSTWYYLWLIYNGTTVSGLVSTSATAPTLPATYTFKGLAGVVYNDSGSNFITFYQGDRVVWLNDTNVVTGANPGTTYAAQSLAAFVPPIAKGLTGTIGLSTANSGGMAVAADANGLGGVTVSAGQGNVTINGFTVAAPFVCPIKTAQTVYIKGDAAAARYRLSISGFTI